ncbi:MAG: NRDE family protein [Planctomycetota bacterium]
MCTVSIIGLKDRGFRLVHSRDEQRNRPAGIAPTTARADNGGCLTAPKDPQAGGTWVAARSDGVSLAVMNVNPTPPPMLPEHLVSRGHLIPTLMGLPAREIREAASRIDAACHAPFRLIAASIGSVTSFTWDGTSFLRAEHRTPCVWATSGLGDRPVTDRVTLFEHAVAGRSSAATQDAYHGHRWPDRGAPSVLMARPDARTVSITTIVQRRDAAPRLRYVAIPETSWTGEG